MVGCDPHLGPWICRELFYGWGFQRTFVKISIIYIFKTFVLKHYCYTLAYSALLIVAGITHTPCVRDSYILTLSFYATRTNPIKWDCSWGQNVPDHRAHSKWLLCPATGWIHRCGKPCYSHGVLETCVGRGLPGIIWLVQICPPPQLKFPIHWTYIWEVLSVELRDRNVSKHRSGEGYQNICAALKVPSFLNGSSLEPPRYFLELPARPNWLLGGEGPWSGLWRRTHWSLW